MKVSLHVRRGKWGLVQFCWHHPTQTPSLSNTLVCTLADLINDFTVTSCDVSMTDKWQKIDVRYNHIHNWCDSQKWSKLSRVDLLWHSGPQLVSLSSLSNIRSCVAVTAGMTWECCRLLQHRAFTVSCTFYWPAAFCSKTNTTLQHSTLAPLYLKPTVNTSE